MDEELDLSYSAWADDFDPDSVEAFWPDDATLADYEEENGHA